uniref:PH domain-containing protein n=1 Tax=Caenorhabditis tropicalis TaxID=1561998 RepID=A0A1I7UFB1_9PELO
MENQFDNIMDRIRARQHEMSGGEETKENAAATQKPIKQEEPTPSSPTKVFGISTKSNDPVYLRPGEPKETTPKSSVSEESKSSTTKKPSRFSMLAQEQEDFEFDYTSQYNKPKEAYMKGRSPRMSIGETRPSVLCAPAGAAKIRSPAKVLEVPKNGPEIALGMSDFEARRIKFAQPISNVNYLPNESSIFSGGSSSANDMSTVLGGSAEMMNVTTSSLSCGEISLNQHVTHENTMINAQSCDNREAILRNMDNMSQDEYGAHTFMRKKTQPTPSTPPKASTTVSSTKTAHERFQPPTNIHALISSPKPFSKEIAGKSVYSPVHFTPRSTSSPKTTVVETVLSPSKTAALEGSVATTRRMQFEKQMTQNTNYFNPPAAPVPTPRHVAPIQSTPHHPYQAQKKNLFPTVQKTLAAKPLVATAPIPVQTQWRGQANTPVVQGARAEDKTAGNQLVGAGAGKLKNLKSRWEFCSTTGTPIHPDATEDSLIATAIKMKETAIPNRIGHRSYGYQPKSSNPQPTRSSTASPSAKTIRKEDYVEYEDDEDVFEEDPSRQNSDDEILDDIECTDTSRFIDNAFGFMEATGVTGTTTPSPFREAPLAKQEESPISPVKNLRKEVIEEEIVQECSDDDDTEVVTPPQDEESSGDSAPALSQKNDSQLAYSVSFYRKVQRERVGETINPLSSVSPSAPVVSLTSPQKLKQLTTPSVGAARIMEPANEAIHRLNKAIKIEEEQVMQSQRALAAARAAGFRGSREEFEAQWALLVHVEKHKALNSEIIRMQRDGPRIIDGPRGNFTIVNVSVSLNREVVQQNIESSGKLEEIHYFVAILRYADQVDVSKMVTSDTGINRRGVLEFLTPMKLTSIPPDFKATLEICGQRSSRESVTHEQKFNLKGATMKAKNRPTFLGGGSTSSGNQSLFSSKDQTLPTAPSASTKFLSLATIQLDINCRGREIRTLADPQYPLGTELLLKVRKEAVDGADIVFDGFLSMYQRTNEGLGSWTRYFCLLENGEMKFWRHPEDEKTKGYLVLMDLSTCCNSEGASLVQETCPYPNSFYVDVWVPEENSTDPRAVTKLRVMLAADTPKELQEWLSVINSTSRQLCTWRNPYRTN